jgi:hypothetical protein
MTLVEAIHECHRRPEMCAVIPGVFVLQISRTGHLMDISKAKGTYARLRSSDLLRLDWQIFTVEQLEEAARAMELQQTAAEALKSE